MHFLISRQKESFLAIILLGKWQVISSVTWNPVLNLKQKAEKFGERLTVKMTIERMIKTLLKRKIIYSFEIIYSRGLVSGITSFSMFLLMRSESLLLSGLAKYLVLKKCFCFYQEICFSFFTNVACKF